MPTSSDSDMDNYNHSDPLHLLKLAPSQGHSEKPPKMAAESDMDNYNHSDPIQLPKLAPKVHYEKLPKMTLEFDLDNYNDYDPMLLLKPGLSKEHVEDTRKVKPEALGKGTQLKIKTMAELSSSAEDRLSSSRIVLPIIPLGECSCHKENAGSKCDFCVRGPIYRCTNCRREFRSHVLLTEHFLIFHDQLKSVCQKCGRGFVNKDHKKRHINCQKGYVCYKCVHEHRSFTTRDQLTAHLMEHKLQCDLCQKLFSSRAGLKNHCLQVHNQVVLSRETPKRNTKIQNKVVQQTQFSIPNIPIGKCTCLSADECFKCKFCRNGPKYVCPNCHKNYRTFEILQRHFVEAHNRHRYLCQECGFGYVGKKSLQKHINRKTCYGFTRSAPVCSDCGKNFKTSEFLQKHIKAVHKLL